ncbi:MAG: outer membrane protein assembly factor BamA, partial [Desulfobacterales bacterium]|nr:outer membrane protein assembly factor BamA [Desulfobacterales bacterium]
MPRRFILIIIAVMLSLSDAAIAAERVRVTVLPFAINAREALHYLSEEIPETIRGHLTREGAVSPIPDPTMLTDIRERGVSLDAARSIGEKEASDYVIWGSLTGVGERFSMDLKMLAPFENTPPRSFFIEGRDIESLSGSVKKLCDELGMILFKRERVTEITVEGNKRIEADAIKRVIKTTPGEVYLVRNISRDLKAIWGMGYFDDVRIESEDAPDGKAVIVRVKEKPTIRRIKIKDNYIYEDDEVRAALNQTVGAILNMHQLRNDVENIKDLYKEKNYHNVKVAHEVIDLDNDQVAVEYTIEEGNKVRVQRIDFVGNEAYSDDELEDLIETSVESFLSWITSAGELDRDNLDQDIARLNAFYHNNGYIQTRISTPEIEFKEEGIDITIKISEGPRFKVGKVEIVGDLVLPAEYLMEKIQIPGEEYFSRETLRKDVLTITDVYSDEGYAYADVNPGIRKDLENLVVNVSLNIRKGKLVYFEKIIITGNTKTRDKVIRRELKVFEQEIYSGVRLKSGIRNLHRLDYFEDVKVDTSKGSDDDKMILKLDVTEKPTGSFSFGGGYSNVESLFGVVTVAQRNLFGRGQTLGLKAHLGAKTTRFDISFVEPWLFDIPLSAGFDIYNWEYDYDTYDKHSMGGGVRIGYPVFAWTRLYVSYTLESADIEDVQDDAPTSIKDLEGNNITSSIATSLQRDTRDKTFNPTEGSLNNITLTYAGVGGNIGFAKVVAESGWYLPIFWEIVGFAHAKGGWV